MAKSTGWKRWLYKSSPNSSGQGTPTGCGWLGWRMLRYGGRLEFCVVAVVVTEVDVIAIQGVCVALPVFDGVTESWEQKQIFINFVAIIQLDVPVLRFWPQYFCGNLD